ncbi:hypothetical protein ABPG75_000426 [Micractinium tetrahymenae]
MRAARQLARALTAEGLRTSIAGSAATLAEVPLRGAASAAALLQQRLRSVLALQEVAAAEPYSPDERQQSTAAAAAAEPSGSHERQQSAAFASAPLQNVGASAGGAEAAAGVEQQQHDQRQALPAAATEQQREGEQPKGQGKRWPSKRPWRGPHRRRQQQPNGVQQERQPQAQQQPREQQQRGEGAQRRQPRPRPPRERRPAQPPLEGKWWRHVPLREQEKPDRLVPILLHYTDTCEEVLELVQLYQAELTPRELTVACRRMGTLISAALAEPRKPPPMDSTRAACAQLFSIGQELLPVMDVQGLATAIWCCSRFHYVPPPEERAAWEAALWEKRQEANLIEIANIFFSLGVLHWAPDQGMLLEELIDAALSGRAAGTLTPWVVCNVMWGCARLVHSRFHPGPQRLMQLMEAALPQLETFTPESFCAMLFSLACLRVRPDDAALTAILDAYEWHVGKTTNRQLVTTVWSMGALQIGPLLTERLWASVEQALQRQADDFNFSSAPLFLFGAARMGMSPSEPVMQLLLSKAEEHAGELRTGDVSVVLWALSRLGYKVGEGPITEEFVKKLVDSFIAHNQVQPATLRHISALLWAATSLKFALPHSTVKSLINDAERYADASDSSLTTTDANMLLSAFEALGSARGLAFLKRHLIGAGGRRRAGDLEDGDDLDVRPNLTI